MLLRPAPLLHALPLKVLFDIDRKVVELRQRAHGGASDVRSVALAPVAGKHGVDYPQPPAPCEDRASAATVEPLAGRVPIGELQVLDDQTRSGLIVTV